MDVLVPKTDFPNMINFENYTRLANRVTNATVKLAPGFAIPTVGLVGASRSTREFWTTRALFPRIGSS